MVCLALVAAFNGFVGLVPASAQRAAPASPSPTLIGTFDPGNIVSDAVFYNTGPGR